MENSWKRSVCNREPATAVQPVTDPGEWYPDDFKGSEEWIYRLSESEIVEFDSAVQAVTERGLDIKDITPDEFLLETFGRSLKGIRDELMDGRGFVLIRGLPMARYSRAQSAAAFFAVGSYLGEAVSQNAKGHLLGHVKDLGMDYGDAQTRGYQTQSQMNFHADQCDILALGCLHPAKSGGESRICSSVALYNEMLRRRPDLAEEMCWQFYWTRHGEIPPGHGF